MPLDEQILRSALSLYQPDSKRIELGRARQGAAWGDGEADTLPIVFGAPVPERNQFPSFGLDEEFHDARVMLYNGLWGLIGFARSASDAVPSIRANFGTGLVASLFGLQSTVFPDKMPWLREHLSKEQIARFSFPSAVGDSGYLSQARGFYETAGLYLDGRAKFYVGDTQGPFDLAHLVRGDDLLYDLHDDPQFVHHLLTLCTDAYIEATLAMKSMIAEPRTRGHHSGCLWLGGGGVRICEDTSTLLSPEHIDAFVVPYTRRAAAAFGGAWVHYCGNNAHLLDAMIDEIDEVCGLNFGNPERHDPASVLRRLVQRGKVYVGAWPREEGEPLREYFQRHLDYLQGARKGLVFMPHIDWERDGMTPHEVVELWHSLQR